MRSQEVIVPVLLLVGLTVPSAGLEPCQDVFSDDSACYHAAVRTLLVPAQRDAPVPFVRTVVIPSFAPEWAVTIYPNGREARVELRVLSKSLGGEFRGCPALAGKSDDVDVQVHSAALSGDLAEEIVAVWREALLHLAPFSDAWSHGSDGVTYHASAWLRSHGLVCGETWSPGSGKNELLVRLTEGLREHAEQPSAESVAALCDLVAHATEKEGSK